MSEVSNMNLDMAQVYTDFSGLTALRAQAREDQEAALDQVAKQFESLFLQMMLKSMRDASFGGGMLDSKNVEFYRDMHDKQMAVELSDQHGIGLAEMIKRQLSQAHPGVRSDMQLADYVAQPIAQNAVSAAQGSDSATMKGAPDEFVEQLWPSAEAAAAELGLAPEALLAQAALETGWGRHVMRHGSGESSHNLFGIKADRRWSGDSVRVETLEYREGVPLKTRADFRAYASYEESFNDYVAFLQSNPRYADALKTTDDSKAYFQALQQAGYATDPEYANKISRILDSLALQSARAQHGEGDSAI